MLTNILCLFIGALIGVMAMSLCVISKDADRKAEYERMKTEHERIKAEIEKKKMEINKWGRRKDGD